MKRRKPMSGLKGSLEVNWHKPVALYLDGEFLGIVPADIDEFTREDLIDAISDYGLVVFLGKHDEIGMFDPECSADFVVVNVDDPDNPPAELIKQPDAVDG
jgi:hypothetical protein